MLKWTVFERKVVASPTCSAEIHIRIASAVVAIARLNRIWRRNTISFASKFRSLVTSILLCGYETWTVLCLLTEKRNQAYKTKCCGKLLRISCLEHKTNIWVWRKITTSWAHRNLFWQVSRDGNLHSLGMSHAMTAFPRPSFRAPWRVGDAVVSRGNVGWTTSKSGQPCPCQNCLQQKGQEEDLCWIVMSLWWPNQSKDWTELNWLLTSFF